MIDVQELVEKLIGPIDPIGETRVDDQRFENLKKTCELACWLITQIDSVAYKNRTHHEYSMRRAGEYAYKFLTDSIGIEE